MSQLSSKLWAEPICRQGAPNTKQNLDQVPLLVLKCNHGSVTPQLWAEPGGSPECLAAFPSAASGLEHCREHTNQLLRQAWMQRMGCELEPYPSRKLDSWLPWLTKSPLSGGLGRPLRSADKWSYTKPSKKLIKSSSFNMYGNLTHPSTASLFYILLLPRQNSRAKCFRQTQTGLLFLFHIK